MRHPFRLRRVHLWALGYLAPVVAALAIALPSADEAEAACGPGGKPSPGYWSDSIPGAIAVYHKIWWTSTLNCSPDYGSVDWLFNQFSSPAAPYMYQAWRTWNCGVFWNYGYPDVYNSTGNNASDYVDYTYSWCGLQSDSNAYYGANLWHYLSY